MKKLYLLLVFCFCINLAFSQTWRRVSHWGNDYNAIHWVNEEVGFIAGKNIILKSIDGGLSWVEQEPPLRTSMLGVSFFNSNIGMMVGLEGKIFRTTDGGDNWTLSDLPSQETFTNLHYFSENEVLVAGKNGRMFHSPDGGNSWNQVSVATNADLNSLHFVDNSLGYSSTSNAEVLKTTDGGQNWKVINTGFDSNLKDIYFVNDTLGYTAGTSATILKSIDGGENWTFINSGVDTDYTMVAFSRVNPNIGLFAGNDGYLMRTTNAGLTLAAVNSRTPQTINDLKFRFNTNTVFAVSNSGTLTSSTNSGGGWAIRLSGNRNDYNATHFKSENHGYIVGENGLVLSTNNGGTSLANRSRPISVSFLSLYFTTNTLGYIGGQNGIILKTTNSGGGWTALNAGTNRDIFGLYFFNNNEGYAIGSRGFISKTENGGVNWTTIDPGNKDIKYNDIKFFNDKVGLIIGENGFLSKTVNNEKWEQISFPAIEYLTSIEILDENAAIITGHNGGLWKTSDQGDTWSKISTPYSIHFNDASFLDEQVGFIAGDKGHIIKTADGGQNWEKIHTGTYQNFTGISFGDLSTGYAVGEAGTFYKYSCLVPESPVVIFGENNICVSQQAYSIQGTSEPGVTYEWRVDGGTILEGQGGTRIVVRWDSPGRHAVMVRGQNNCGNSATRAMEIAVSSEPGQVSEIIGNGSVCINSFETYEVDSLIGTEYYWETNGGIIREGQGTGKITVEWTNLNDYNLKVSPVNPCGAGSTVSKAIKINREPDMPSEIKGAAMTGLGMEEEYEIAAIADMSYQWQVDGPGQILSGQGTPKIKVKWSEEGDFTLSVIPTNSCGTGEAREKSVNVDFITSTERTPDLHWKMYPNPSNGSVNLDLNGISDPRKIEVISSTGKIVREIYLTSPQQLIELQNLPKGLFTIRVIGRTQDYIKKLVVN
ncbi:T9SS type A sorting domain-containing protein [Litoribacter ruber]|uniref:YCF48-related protein n=1 Tax=Litoribacter ruber TaxID=702568 RepID=UPI001BDA3CE0|nr:YCF48-related protein [Litoribacter ruber]MBT0812086.1 T9SS type A sorting domain-containing protein [Litoribacter ruber]